MFDFDSIELQRPDTVDTCELIVDVISKWMDENIKLLSVSVHNKHIYAQAKVDQYGHEAYYTYMVRILASSPIFQVIKLLPHPIKYFQSKSSDVSVSIYLDTNKEIIEKEAQIAYLWIKQLTTVALLPKRSHLIIKPTVDSSMIRLEKSLHMFFDRLSEMGITADDMRKTHAVQIYTNDNIGKHTFSCLQNCYTYFEVIKGQINL